MTVVPFFFFRELHTLECKIHSKTSEEEKRLLHLGDTCRSNSDATPASLDLDFPYECEVQLNGREDQVQASKNSSEHACKNIGNVCSDNATNSESENRSNKYERKIKGRSGGGSQKRNVEVEVAVNLIQASTEDQKHGSADQAIHRESVPFQPSRKKPCPYGRNCCLSKKCNYSHPTGTKNTRKPARNGLGNLQIKESDDYVKHKDNADIAGVSLIEGSTNVCSKPCKPGNNSTEDVCCIGDRDCLEKDGVGGANKQLKALHSHQPDKKTSQNKTVEVEDCDKDSKAQDSFHSVGKDQLAEGVPSEPSNHCNTEQKVEENASCVQSSETLCESSQVVPPTFPPAYVQSATSAPHSVMTNCFPANFLPQAAIYQPNMAANPFGASFVPSLPIGTEMPLLNPVMVAQLQRPLNSGMFSAAMGQVCNFTAGNHLQDSNLLSSDGSQQITVTSSGNKAAMHGTSATMPSVAGQPLAPLPDQNPAIPSSTVPVGDVPIDQRNKVGSGEFCLNPRTAESQASDMGKVTCGQQAGYQVNGFPLPQLPLPPSVPFALPGGQSGYGMPVMPFGLAPVSPHLYYQNMLQASVCDMQRSSTAPTQGPIMAKPITRSVEKTKESNGSTDPGQVSEGKLRRPMTGKVQGCDLVSVFKWHTCTSRFPPLTKWVSKILSL